MWRFGTGAKAMRSNSESCGNEEIEMNIVSKMVNEKLA
jgi:hypothetical protein